MAFRSPVFRKLFLSALALIALTLATVDFFFTRYAGRQESEALQRELAGVAAVLTGEAGAVPRGVLENWAKNAEGLAHARITVIGSNGMVLADSEHDPETMENHRSRPEVQSALKGQTGSATRRSATLDRDLFYVAVPLTYEGRPGYVLRLAAPLRTLDDAVAAVRRRILWISLGAAALALAMAYWFSTTFTARVRKLQHFAGVIVQEGFSGELSRDADDELGELAASLNQMAERMRDFVERLSLESNRREAILESMVEGVLAVDSEMRVLFCNPAFAHAVNARGAVQERLPLLELVRDPAFLDLLSRTLVTGQTAIERMQLADAGGRAYEVHAALLMRAGSRRAALVVLHDVTELERLERIRKDFVANVSHELRTPLTAIRGYAETLLEGALEDPENNRRFVEIILTHSIRLGHIASDLLTLSELESGREDAAVQSVSIRETLEQAARTVAAEARRRGVALLLGSLDDACVLGRPVRIEQVFINLLDNAVKFNRPGGEVRVEAALDSGGRVKITVADTGIGIPYEDRSRVFERFYRVDKGRSREAGGTGLGLSIVKHVVERMGGSVSVESELGTGSVFTVTMPAAG